MILDVIEGEEFLYSSAIFSDDRAYRFSLTRRWDRSLPLLAICGLNPSKAGAKDSDNTITREIDFARAWGFGGLLKVNACALVSTDPKGLRSSLDPVGLNNNDYIFSALRDPHVGMFVAAWGALSGAPTWLRTRAETVLQIAIAERDVHCFRITAKGMPEHPLYLPKGLHPQIYRKRRRQAAQGA